MYEKKKHACIDVSLIKNYQDDENDSGQKLLVFYKLRLKRAITAEYRTNNLGTSYAIEDLIQDSYLLFLEAAKKFDTSKDTKNLFNYCIQFVHWRLIDVIRKVIKYNKHLTNFECNNIEESYNPDYYENIKARELVENSLKLLSNRDRDICNLFLINDGLSSLAAQEKFGISLTRCSQIYQSFSRKIINNQTNN
jgi:RNA polymerase sigma factor (sigma-70 family)